jgi:heme-degrading monooxygenase HmoA
MSKSITTLTFFRFPTFADRVWAFFLMQFAHAHISKAKGKTFYKLMGSGRDMGFNPAPDWSVYSLLVVWENEAAANDFFDKSDIIKRYRAHTSEIWTLFLRVRQVKGLWSGVNPFEPSSEIDEANPLISVITRASIRPSKLITFWRYVPTSQRPIVVGCDGLIYTKGIGEAPLIQMATFSLWRDFEALKKFAYQSEEHRVAIEKTKKLDWYSEEMFVRFQPYKTHGTWGNTTLSL